MAYEFIQGGTNGCEQSGGMTLEKSEEVAGIPLRSVRWVLFLIQCLRPLDLLGWDPGSSPREGVIKASFLVSLNLNVLICEMGLTTPSPGGL